MPSAVKESVSGQDERHTVWICFYTAITCYNTVLSFLIQGPVFKTDLSANPGTTNTTTNDSETTELLKRHTDY